MFCGTLFGKHATNRSVVSIRNREKYDSRSRPIPLCTQRLEAITEIVVRKKDVGLFHLFVWYQTLHTPFAQHRNLKFFPEQYPLVQGRI